MHTQDADEVRVLEEDVVVDESPVELKSRDEDEKEEEKNDEGKEEAKEKRKK